MTITDYNKEIKTLEQHLKRLKTLRRAEVRRLLKTHTLRQLGEMSGQSHQMIAYYAGPIGKRKRKAVSQ